uniref:Uncharacterized protein n=1 Tax=Anguilla anguilla TaxID=7936 RepID=A0A0E9W7D3_ANGAN
MLAVLSQKNMKYIFFLKGSEIHLQVAGRSHRKKSCSKNFPE